MHSDAVSVEEYLDDLAERRRTQVQLTLDAVRPHLPEGLEEAMDFGMITWAVPLTVVPETYNGKPLMFGGLASQKNHISLYLMPLYAGVPISEEEFRSRWSGRKRLNMGKSCVRFKDIDDIDVPLIQQVLDATTLQDFIDAYHRR